MTLLSTRYYSIDYHPESRILRLDWTSATTDMAMDDFQEALHNFAGFAFDHETRGMLVDIREFRYRPTPELGHWRDEHISPRYVKAGLKKFAYIAPAGALEKMKGQLHGRDRGFAEDYFQDEAAAMAWLSS